jgi:hypothetical protein
MTAVRFDCGPARCRLPRPWSTTLQPHLERYWLLTTMKVAVLNGPTQVGTRDRVSFVLRTRRACPAGAVLGLHTRVTGRSDYPGGATAR